MQGKGEINSSAVNIEKTYAIGASLGRAVAGLASGCALGEFAQ
jgi:hypothetical protein